MGTGCLHHGNLGAKAPSRKLGNSVIVRAIINGRRKWRGRGGKERRSCRNDLGGIDASICVGMLAGPARPGQLVDFGAKSESMGKSISEGES